MKENPAHKKTDEALAIDHEDKMQAIEKMIAVLDTKRPGWQVHHARPDDNISPAIECTPDEATARRDFEILSESLNTLGISLKDKRTLEVGSGMGYLLSVLRQEGVNAVGIDFSPRDYKRMQDVHIIDAPLGALKSEKAGYFGVIVAKNVFDDDRYPFQVYKDMLEEIDSLLEPGGIFVKMGTGNFTEEDIPQDWKRHSRSGGYGLDIFQKS